MTAAPASGTAVDAGAGAPSAPLPDGAVVDDALVDAPPQAATSSAAAPAARVVMSFMVGRAPNVAVERLLHHRGLRRRLILPHRRYIRWSGSARSTSARAPRGPAPPGRLGAVRFTRGRRGPRAGDVRPRAGEAAPAARHGRARLPDAGAAQHVPDLAARRVPAAARRGRAR